MPQAHDRAILQPGGDLKLGRQGFAIDHEAVVAGRLEGRRKATEDPFTGVMHGSHLAVHDLVAAHDLAAEGLADGLVSQQTPRRGMPALAAALVRGRQMPAAAGSQGRGRGR